MAYRIYMDAEGDEYYVQDGNSPHLMELSDFTGDGGLVSRIEEFEEINPLTLVEKADTIAGVLRFEAKIYAEDA